jgi:hypothetical protein
VLNHRCLPKLLHSEMYSAVQFFASHCQTHKSLGRELFFCSALCAACTGSLISVFGIDRTCQCPVVSALGS